MSTEEKCINCKFHLINAQNVKEGFCRFNPPKIIPIPTQQGINVQGCFPPTGRDSWCGKWEAKP